MKNKTALVFGIVLIFGGIIASVYYDTPLAAIGNPYVRTYPLKDLGFLLVVAGIVFTAVAFFTSPEKHEST